MAEKNNANIGFEKQIWDAACVLWGHIPAAEYRKVIVGLIFLRYISSAFEKRYNELVAEGDGFENEPDAYLEDNIFFVPDKARWSTIAAAAHTPEIGTVIDDAMRAIEDDNKTLKNVLPKNYASPDLDKRVLGDVVDLFTNMDMTDTEDSKDLLGRTYEYCIAQFAAYEGVKGGEFYTPSSIVKTIVAILNPFENCRVYDPCCGSGGMFVQSAKFIQAHSGKRGNISVYGQESNADTWKMAKMNDLCYNCETYSDILKQLKPNPREPFLNCHVDPDIRDNNRKAAIVGWKPAFGQCEAAQGLLSNAGVEKGDIFLFFGWFRQTEKHNGSYRFVSRKNGGFYDHDDMHIIYGYMQIGDMLSNGDDLAKYSWHPHSAFVERNVVNNAIYTPTETLSLLPKLRGYGTLDYRKDRVLTMEGKSRGTWNDLPFLRPEHTYGKRKNSAKGEGLYYSGIWQELVVYELEGLIDWAKSVIK